MAPGVTGIRMQLLGIKSSAQPRIGALKELGCIPTREAIDCPQCPERYQVLIDPGIAHPAGVGILDLDSPLQTLRERISGEHSAGHSSELLIAECQASAPASRRPAPCASFLNLSATEQITACWPTTSLRDCSSCVRCQEAAFRLLQITAHEGKHRYLALCTDHFLAACLGLPELINIEFKAA